MNNSGTQGQAFQGVPRRCRYRELTALLPTCRCPGAHAGVCRAEEGERGYQAQQVSTQFGPRDRTLGVKQQCPADHEEDGNSPAYEHNLQPCPREVERYAELHHFVCGEHHIELVQQHDRRRCDAAQPVEVRHARAMRCLCPHAAQAAPPRRVRRSRKTAAASSPKESDRVKAAHTMSAVLMTTDVMAHLPVRPRSPCGHCTAMWLVVVCVFMATCWRDSPPNRQQKPQKQLECTQNP